MRFNVHQILLGWSNQKGWDGACSTNARYEKYKRNNEKLKGKTTYKSWGRWVDNIKVNIKGIVSAGVDWIYVAHFRVQLCALVTTVTNIRVTENAGNLTSWATLFSSVFRENATFLEVWKINN